MIEESKNFISKYVKSFSASRYRIKSDDKRILSEILPKLLVTQENILSVLKDIKYENFMLEIGSGRGDFISHYAKTYPKTLCIGLDAYQGGLIQTVYKIQQNNLENVRLFHGDGRIILDLIPDNSLKMIAILFPDPWPKRKHNIRRIVNIEYISSIKNKLKSDGILFSATDDAAYQIQMRQVFSGIENYDCAEFGDDEMIKNEWYKKTKYHAKANLAGRFGKFFVLKNKKI